MTAPWQPAMPGSIELWDETLREGAERSPLSPTVADKLTLADASVGIGLRTLLVGMFPDVPHNVELLRALLEKHRAGGLPEDTRFIVISHLGVTLDESFARLEGLGLPLDHVCVLGIHSASDLQIEHLYPTIRAKDPADDLDHERWVGLPVASRRAENIEWFERELKRLDGAPTGGRAVGLLDSFRADVAHVTDLVRCVERAGIARIRLVDTAGTATPGAIETHVRPLTEAFPGISFYGHFHDDFGLATANALLGIQAGLRGVDVSIGGFANRAGHPALAEVSLALRILYGRELPGFRYERLHELSRLVEKVYGLIEKATQPITGVATHGVSAGIRTQLIDRAPTIFDVIDPASVGARLDRAFGVRSGTDGVRRFLSDHAEELGITADRVDELSPAVFDLLMAEWKSRTDSAATRISEAIGNYHALLRQSVFTENDMIALVRNHLAAGTR